MSHSKSAQIVLALVVFSISSSDGLWAQNGEILYKSHCASCHEAGGESRAPGRDSFRQMSPEQILTALERGAMALQGSQRTAEERRAIAMFLSGKSFGSEPVTSTSTSGSCSTPAAAFQNSVAGPSWNGWGVAITNTRFQPNAAAGISPGDVPRLRLKWAFGFPGEVTASAQPAVLGGRVFLGSNSGKVYSLDAKTGCVYWIFEADGGVRTAISIGEMKTAGLAAYFGDAKGFVYAVNPADGQLRWKVRIDDQPGARMTGAPTLYDGRLYVPVTPGEEGAAGRPDYECCKSRGLVAALDAATGKHLWKTYTILEQAQKTEKNRIGTQLWGPSGAGVWSAPTADVKRRTIYVATGNNYSLPATDTSDAVLALDMDSGKIKWTRQMTPGDTWNMGCNLGRDNANCPDADDPDFDFGASPLLVDLRDGRQLILAGQKSGVVYALDPDREGKIVWEQRVGKGGIRGGIEWGPAADGDAIYAAVSDAVRLTASSFDPNAGGGLTALDLTSGQKMWYAAPAPCGDRRPCIPAQEAAVTVLPGVVFSGSMDGHLRAYSTRDGKVLWDYDTVREYMTVNGVAAKGGSIGNGGVAVVDGMLFTNSGYSNVLPGNVLLAFSVE